MSYRQEFWETMKILVERDFKRNIHDDILDWIDNFAKKLTTTTHEDDGNESIAARNRKLSECSALDEELEEQVQTFLKMLEKKLKKIDCRYEIFFNCDIF